MSAAVVGSPCQRRRPSGARRRQCAAVAVAGPVRQPHQPRGRRLAGRAAGPPAPRGLRPGGAGQRLPRAGWPIWVLMLTSTDAGTRRHPLRVEI